MNNGVATFLFLVALLETSNGRGFAPWWPKVIGRRGLLPLSEAFVSTSTPTMCHGKGWFGFDHQPKRRCLRACSPTAVLERRGVKGRGGRELIVIRASAAGERDLESCVRRLDVAVSERRKVSVACRC